MTLRNFVLAVGVALLVVGFAGFAWPNLLGMHLTPTHMQTPQSAGAAPAGFR